MRSIEKALRLALVLAATGCALHRAPAQSALHAAGPVAPPVPAAATVEPVSLVAQSRASRGSPRVGVFVRARQMQLQYCYQETRAASPALAGSATVAVRLEDDGRVREADIVRRSWSGGDAGSVESCVLSRVRSWHFPPMDSADEHVHSFALIFSR